MPLICCGLNGVDEATALAELAVVSDLYPFVEWGFLYSPDQQGTPGRYPSVGRIRRAFKELPRYVRTALHLSGPAVEQLLQGENVVCGLAEQVRARNGRVQLNLRTARANVDPDALRRFVVARPEIFFVTQYSDGNANVMQALAGVANHAIVFDSSADRDAPPQSWPRAPESMRCGYAGGLGVHNLEVELPRIYHAAGTAEFWIDIEGRLRDQNDRFSMSLARRCLEIVSAQASKRMEMPGPRPLRRRCEPIELIDSGLMHDDAARELEAMLRLLIQATRDVVDPAIVDVRRKAENLLLRKGMTPARSQPSRTH